MNFKNDSAHSQALGHLLDQWSTGWYCFMWWCDGHIVIDFNTPVKRLFSECPFEELDSLVIGLYGLQAKIQNVCASTCVKMPPEYALQHPLLSRVRL